MIRLIQYRLSGLMWPAGRVFQVRELSQYLVVCMLQNLNFN